MGISPMVTGGTIGGGYSTSLFSSLAAHKEQNAFDRKTLSDVPLPIRENVPGNRLYSLDGRTIELAQESLPFVVGKVLAKVVQVAASHVVAAKDEAISLVKTVSQKWFRPSSALSCYESILIQYPTADENSLSIAQTLCNNTVSELLIYNVQLNSAGVQAIAAALAQNTALTTLSFSNVYCDTTTFATAIVTALQTNPNLQNLSLDFGDINPGPIIPSPMTSIAARTIFQKLPCFNLSSLDMGFIDLTSVTAQTLLTTFQHNPYFPLSKLALSWHINNDLLNSQIDLVFQALNQSRCITEFQPATYTGLSADKMVSLFQAIGGNQSVSLLNLWCTSSYSFNNTQTQAILDAIIANPCFLNYTNAIPEDTCFEPNLTEAIQNITQGRTPCERDPQCSAPPTNCSGAKSDVPPGSTPSSPSSRENITQTVPFRIALAVAGTVFAVGVGLGIKRWCSKRREEFQPGAEPENVDVPQAAIPLETRIPVNKLADDPVFGQNTQDTLLPTDPPSGEGLPGESEV